MKSKNLALSVLIGASFACSTAKVHVMPGENGLNTVVSTDYESDGSEEAAVKKATEYCEKRGKQVAFVNPENKSQYTGKMDEGTRHAIKKASEAAILVGGPVGAGTHDAVLGGGIGTAGVVGRSMVNDRDYKTELNFKCN